MESLAFLLGVILKASQVPKKRENCQSWNWTRSQLTQAANRVTIRFHLIHTLYI